MSLNVKTIDQITSTATDLTGTTYIPISQDGTTKKLPSSFFAGTYVATVTIGSNCDSVSCFTCNYHRSGGVVTVSSQGNINQTTTITATEFGISLPVASNFGSTRDCNGSFIVDEAGNTGGWITADTTNDRASFNTRSIVGTGAVPYYFVFQYTVI